MNDEKSNEFISLGENSDGLGLVSKRPYGEFIQNIAQAVMSELDKKFPKTFSEGPIVISPVANMVSGTNDNAGINPDVSNGTPEIVQARKEAIASFKELSAKGLKSPLGLHIYSELYQRKFPVQAIRDVLSPIEREQVGID